MRRVHESMCARAPRPCARAGAPPSPENTRMNICHVASGNLGVQHALVVHRQTKYRRVWLVDLPRDLLVPSREEAVAVCHARAESERLLAKPRTTPALDDTVDVGRRGRRRRLPARRVQTLRGRMRSPGGWRRDTRPRARRRTPQGPRRRRPIPTPRAKPRRQKRRGRRRPTRPSQAPQRQPRRAEGAR